ncbi:fascin domain-containing protein [Rugosimonospora africana]|uniref:Uncharacterized protein n=1 Tax=Rugosimonospora africana TaxID=556532 RepID=A0A8J3VUX9_9ACTN|nr:hypothetical protein [Rugosimonospora africana]GIH19153.1 hypothetical protein Raf01_73250 [Rugosimonospora africana]
MGARISPGADAHRLAGPVVRVRSRRPRHCEVPNSEWRVIGNRTAIGPWEEFDLFVNADGSVSLHAHANSPVVTAANAGSSPLIASSTAIGQGEEFDLLND